MALKSFDDTGVQFAWDATSLAAFERCPRYYQYNMLEGWEPNKPNDHFIFGSAYAKALEHYFKYRTEGMTADEALCQVVHEAMIATWTHDLDEDGQPIPDSGQPWQSLHNTKNRETLIRSIVWYFDHFADDPMKTVQLKNGKPAVELSFTIRIPTEEELLWVGHLDRLVEYKGGLYVMDQKTTGNTITTYYWTQFSPDTQMSGYTWAGKTGFASEIKGVVIDAAQIAVGFTRFARSIIGRSNVQLEEWIDDTIHHIRTAREMTAKGYFPQNRQSCQLYGGCTYKDVCALAPHARKAYLEGYFTRRKRWDPLERR